MTAREPLVIELRIPRSAAYARALFFLMPVIGVVILVLSNSLGARIVGAGSILTGIWISGIFISLRRRPLHSIVVTEEGIAAPGWWSVAWPDVVSAGIRKRGSVRILELRVRDPAAFVRSLPSPFMRFNERVSLLCRIAPVRLVEPNLDRSLEEMWATLDEYAGRAL